MEPFHACICAFVEVVFDRIQIACVCVCRDDPTVSQMLYNTISSNNTLGSVFVCMSECVSYHIFFLFF
jgi:hypothetical protein